MFGKLAEAKQKAAEIKERLEHISVMGQSDDGCIKVVVSGGRRVLDIQTGNADMNSTESKSSLIQAMNRALESADKVAESEMASIAKDILPGGLGSLAGMFK